MPYFGEANVKYLPDLAMLADGGETANTDNALAKGNLDAGRQLMGTQGGLGCIMCHSWNDRKSLGIPGLNLSTTAERLQPAWFRQNLLNPASLRPRTLMPTFWPSGEAVNKNVLHGDTEKQIASLWRFLAEGRQTPPGYPEFSKGAYEIVPKDHVVVQRTFTRAGGTHSIVVGHPRGVHYIFDSATGHAVLAWRGHFIDGYSTWFDRFAAPAEPLGDHQQVLPSADLLSLKANVADETGDAAKYRYRGYRLDHEGSPTFLYAVGSAEVADAIVPLMEQDKAVGLRRTLVVVSKVDGMRFTLPQTKGLRIVITKPKTWPGKTGPQPLPAGKTVIKLEYRW